MAKKKKPHYDPFDEDLVFISEGVYRKRRWSKNNKTNQYGWHTFGYVAIVQTSDRTTQIEAPRLARTKGVWVSEFVENPARPTVYITCPHCAAIMKVDKHRIKEDGELDPCVVCPRDECRRHVFMVLKGWPHGRFESISDWDKKVEWDWSEMDGPIDAPTSDAPASDPHPPSQAPEPSPIREREMTPNLLDERRKRWFGLW
jgi:hypothetical protein